MSLLFAFSSPFGEELHFLDAYSHGQSISRVVVRHGGSYRSIAGTPENLERILTYPNLPDILFLYGHGDVVGDTLLLEDGFCERVQYFFLRALLDRIPRNHRKGGVLILGMCFSKRVFDMVRTELEQIFSHIVVINGAIRGRVLNLFSLHFLELLYGGSTVLDSFFEAMKIACYQFPTTALESIQLFPDSRAHHEIPFVQHFGGLEFGTRVAAWSCPPLADVVAYVKFGHTVSHDVYYALVRGQRTVIIGANHGCGVTTLLVQVALRCCPRGLFHHIKYFDVRKHEWTQNKLAIIGESFSGVESPENRILLIFDGFHSYFPEFKTDKEFIRDFVDLCPNVTVLHSVHYGYNTRDEFADFHLNRIDNFGIAWLILISIQNDLHVNHVTEDPLIQINGCCLDQLIMKLAEILANFSFVNRLQGNPLAVRLFCKSDRFLENRDFLMNEDLHCDLADDCLNRAVAYRQDETKFPSNEY